MVASQFIIDLFDLLLDDMPQADLVRAQLEIVESIETDYTGVGVFYRFSFPLGVKVVALEGDVGFWNGVKLVSSAVPNEAEAFLHFKKGLIDYLEVWAYGGDHYPHEELLEYVMRQDWKGSPGRSIQRGPRV